MTGQVINLRPGSRLVDAGSGAILPDDARADQEESDAYERMCRARGVEPIANMVFGPPDGEQDLARPAEPSTARVRLRPLARLDVEQARRFLMELDGRMRDANASRLAYLIGALEGHAQSLMDVIDAVTEV